MTQLLMYVSLQDQVSAIIDYKVNMDWKRNRGKIEIHVAGAWAY